MNPFPPLTPAESAELHAHAGVYDERRLDLWTRSLLNKWGIDDGHEAAQRFHAVATTHEARSFWSRVSARLLTTKEPECAPVAAPQWRDEAERRPSAKPTTNPKQGSLF